MRFTSITFLSAWNVWPVWISICPPTIYLDRRFLAGRWDHGSSRVSSQASRERTYSYNCYNWNVQLYISRMMHMFALCFLSPLWVESTHRWQGCITSVTHFDSSTRTLRFWCQVTSPPLLARATTPQFGSVDHIFCLATSPTSKPGLSCICQCSGYRFLTDN